MLQFLKRLFFEDRRYYPQHLVNGTDMKRISFGGEGHLFNVQFRCASGTGGRYFKELCGLTVLYPMRHFQLTFSPVGVKVIYFMLLLTLIPIVSVIGWYGASLTFPLGRK